MTSVDKDDFCNLKLQIRSFAIECIWGGACISPNELGTPYTIPACLCHASNNGYYVISKQQKSMNKQK